MENKPAKKTVARALKGKGRIGSTIPACPCALCTCSHKRGKHPCPAGVALAVSETMNEDQILINCKTAKMTVAQALASLVGPGGPYEGEVVTAQTFTNPATPAQRGLRRACMKFLEVFIEAAKADDRMWIGQFPADQIATLVPHFEISLGKDRLSMVAQHTPPVQWKWTWRQACSKQSVGGGASQPL